MKNLLLAVLLAIPAQAARRKVAVQEDEPKKETYSAMAAEAKAIMGEMKYQHGDLQGAGETFKDSLNSARSQMTPQDHVIGLDLYRTAELAARRGDFNTARKNLDILLSRYPDSDYS